MKSNLPTLLAIALITTIASNIPHSDAAQNNPVGANPATNIGPKPEDPNAIGPKPEDPACPNGVQAIGPKPEDPAKKYKRRGLAIGPKPEDPTRGTNNSTAIGPKPEDPCAIGPKPEDPTMPNGANAIGPKPEDPTITNMPQQ